MAGGVFAVFPKKTIWLMMNRNNLVITSFIEKIDIVKGQTRGIFEQMLEEFHFKHADDDTNTLVV